MSTISSGCTGRGDPNMYLCQPRTVKVVKAYLDDGFCVRTIEAGLPKSGGGSGSLRPTVGQLFPRSH